MRALLVVIGLVACRRAATPAVAPPPPPRAERSTAALEAELLAARDRQDVAAMRAHGWRVWAELQGAWPRWPSSDVVAGRPDRIFRALAPFRIGDRIEVETAPTMFAVVFDPVAAAHARRSRVRARPRRGAMPAFPRDAITLKPVWYAIHRDRVTALPVWDGAPTRPDGDGNPTRTWAREVLVVPPGADGPDHNADDAAGRRRVGLDAFVVRTLATDAEVVAARRAARDPTLAIGDLAVLVGMHVATKQIPDWVWITLWWHDRPDSGPYAAGRPARVRGPAAHYLMDVAYSADTPAAADGGPHAAMNPWLEARFPGGLRSNCVACHQRAALGAETYLPVTRGPTAATDPYFADKLTTDFVWSLALEP